MYTLKIELKRFSLNWMWGRKEESSDSNDFDPSEWWMVVPFSGMETVSSRLVEVEPLKIISKRVDF